MSLFTSVNIFLSFTLLTVHSTAPDKFTSKHIFEVYFLEVLVIVRDDFIIIDYNKPASFIFNNNFSIKPPSTAEKSTSVPSSRFLLTPSSSGTHYSSLYKIQVLVLIYFTPAYKRYRFQFSYILLQVPTTPAYTGYRLKFSYILLQVPTTPDYTRYKLQFSYILLQVLTTPEYTGYRLQFSYILLQVPTTPAFTGYRLQFSYTYTRYPGIWCYRIISFYRRFTMDMFCRPNIIFCIDLIHIIYL